MKIAISPHHNQLIYSPTIARPLLPTHHPMSQPNTNTFSIPYALLNDGINANTGKLTSTCSPFILNLSKPSLVKKRQEKSAQESITSPSRLSIRCYQKAMRNQVLWIKMKAFLLITKVETYICMAKAQKLDQLEKEIQLVTVHEVQEALRSLDPEDLLHPQFSWKEDTYI